jgi:hypothetical protein
MIHVKRPIFFSGENPGLTLYAPGTEGAVAVASYWHCTDSPMGVGHALVLWLKDENAAIGHGGVFTDNLKLAEMLVKKLTQYFPEFENVPISALQYMQAHCGHTYDGTSYRVTCQMSAAQVELEWSEPLDRKQILWPGFPAGEDTYDLSTVIRPCKIGKVQINGKGMDGEVKVTQNAEGMYASSAFLAFAETWIGPVEKEG